MRDQFAMVTLLKKIKDYTAYLRNKNVKHTQQVLRNALTLNSKFALITC